MRRRRRQRRKKMADERPFAVTHGSHYAQFALDTRRFEYPPSPAGKSPTFVMKSQHFSRDYKRYLWRRSRLLSALTVQRSTRWTRLSPGMEVERPASVLLFILTLFVPRPPLLTTNRCAYVLWLCLRHKQNRKNNFT